MLKYQRYLSVVGLSNRHVLLMSRNGLESVGLDPNNLVSVAFDGASNMSGKKGGVQALLREHSPNLVFVHCRSHLLQLALVRSATVVAEVRRTFSMLNKL